MDPKDSMMYQKYKVSILKITIIGQLKKLREKVLSYDDEKENKNKELL